MSVTTSGGGGGALSEDGTPGASDLIAARTGAAPQAELWEVASDAEAQLAKLTGQVGDLQAESSLTHRQQSGR